MPGVLAGALERMRENLGELHPHVRIDSIGRIVSVGDGVAVAVGLERPVLGELLIIGSDIAAHAEEVDSERVRLVLLAPGAVRAGDPVRRAGHVLHVPAGPGLLGRVVDPLGRPLDRKGNVATRRTIRIERPPVPLIDRDVVSRPLRTGIFTLDTMIPIGRGQRQLLLGDRSTGKTELGIELLAALDPTTIGVYVAIGRRGSETASTLAQLRARGVLEHGFAVVSDADDPVGLVHLTPYAASAMAESLVEAGHDVVVVYDDLTNHAHAHRSLALLLDRPVGREAHPVDVFYAHARLLEQGAQLCARRGGGSLTAIPIIETQAGDLAGYIPTNLVSITDGQIRLDAALAAAGQHPAIDVSLSVSRVGGRAQPELIRALAGSFKNRYAQFLELETFARFGTKLEASAQIVIDWGRRVRKVLQQERGELHRWAETVARLLLVDEPGFSQLPLERTTELVGVAVARMLATPSFDARGIDEGRVDVEAIETLRAMAREAARSVFVHEEGSVPS
uniref:ATP synthase F1 alpha subunit n=1 Tax=uncultured bacterium pSY1435 TaxID=561717 RepID=C4N426_9BACT|nr:ATP synthase F1 alpha subunit [uncultured bacterium pSY1435]